jgi:diphthine methyl ester acylhydrolase
MPLVEPVQTLFLPIPPSCLEFCPQSPDLFVVGTYHLHHNDASADQITTQGDDSAQSDDLIDQDSKESQLSKPQQRSGSLVLFRVMDTAGKKML